MYYYFIFSKPKHSLDLGGGGIGLWVSSVVSSFEEQKGRGGQTGSYMI